MTGTGAHSLCSESGTKRRHHRSRRDQAAARVSAVDVLAVSGKDASDGQPCFKALLERIVNFGGQVVLVEDVN